MARTRNNSTQYVRLEKRLVLVAWLNSLLGYKSNKDALADMREPQEGFDPYARSFIYHHLASRGDKVKIPLPILGRYDDNIRNHLAAMNVRRAEPITLRYFQYLAVLYAEVYLDWRYNRSGELLKALNDFVDARNSARPAGDPSDAKFTRSDLDKLAFWMATGSGKTLIMHFNYRQFLHYNRDELDNILLVTPNEGLTEQHIEEMELSGIPCARFSPEESGLGFGDKHIVRVIEITKLVEHKRGGGVSVSVESFEGNNLILVDEGHKGSGGEKWRSYRDAIGKTGFTFEYSATFGQALTASRKDELTAEYGKSIVFDYSYKYFHGDGFGKDFHILNLRDETTEDATETLLLGNLLSFHEQRRCFAEQSDSLRQYNLEQPLWVFVGSSVNAVYTEDRRKRSDVLTVARFLHHVLENKRSWAVLAIKKIIEGKTGLIDASGEDVFAGKFEYLKSAKLDPESIYRQVLAEVFRAPAGGTLHLCGIRGSQGELGLKVSGAEEYFGLIYIGDTTAFKKLVDADDSGIVQEEDVIADSLFDGINDPGTSINVLIGAKKFMEGWNSWRVSNMGLLNIGRSEGSEIIQLFGRGVRLRGLHMSLKRSSAIDGEHPAHIRLLETLNIFAVRADYMAQFREYLQREGVETEGSVELPLEIRPNEDFLGKGLVVPRLPDGRSFAAECDIILQPDKAARVSLDMSLKVESMRSSADGVATVAMRAGQEQIIPGESLDLVDWESVYLQLLEYKKDKQFSNLVIQQDMPRRILTTSEPRMYKLIADEGVVKPGSFADVAILQEVVLSVLRKYVEKYYRVCQQRWDFDHMVYGALDSDHLNFQDYTVKIRRNEAELITAIEKLIKEADSIYRENNHELPSIHFDRHLYQPLLVERDDKVKSEPPGLNDSERQFVEDIRTYCRSEKDKSLADKEVYLLRNLTRGKGIGFFDKRGFYPDFILWVKDNSAQRIVFIEPHGMLHAEAYMHDDKARLHESLPKLAKAMGARTKLKNVTLDSFIISATTYDDLRVRYDDGTWTKQQFADRHILFFERTSDYDYPSMLFA